MVTKKIIIGASVITLLGASAGFLTAFAGSPTKYEVQAVSKGNVSETLEISGTVHGDTTKTIYASVTAPILQYNFKVGDEVTKDSKIAEYDTTDLLTALSQATISSESAENAMKGQIQQSDQNQARYNKAAQDETTYMYLYAMARSDFNTIDQEQYQENWDLNCVASSIEKKIAEKNKEIANKQADQIGVAYGSDSYNDLEKDITKLQGEIASLNYDLAALPPTTLSPSEYAKAVLAGDWESDIMRNWTQATTVKNKYEGTALNSYQKDQLQNSLDLSTLSVETAQNNLNKAIEGVYSELNGIVTESFVNEGSMITKGSPIVTIEGTDTMKVDVGVSKYDIGKIIVGQRATIDIAGHVYEGHVGEIKRLAQTTDSDKAKVTVSVVINEPDEYTYIGLEADVNITTGGSVDSLLMPSAGLYSDDDGDYCYVIRGGVVEKVYVTTGVEADSLVEVTSGLSMGDEVIIDAVAENKIGSKAQAK